MKINLSKLDFNFSKKPLLIGGKAMEYYGLRKAGADIDFIACKKDVEALIKKYPKCVKDLWGDLGLKVHGFEIWKTVYYSYYEDLLVDAVEEDNYYVISLRNLLYQKAIVMDEQKYLNDLKLVAKKIRKIEGEKYKVIKKENRKILSSLSEVEYLDKKGPDRVTSF